MSGDDVGQIAIQIAARLGEKAFRRRALGALYLDQGFLAGNGNYLRSEVLYFSGLHPARRPADLDDAARERLARETLRVARRSYRTAGITNPPSRVEVLKSQGLRRGAFRFADYLRATAAEFAAEMKALLAFGADRM